MKQQFLDNFLCKDIVDNLYKRFNEAMVPQHLDNFMCKDVVDYIYKILHKTILNDVHKELPAYLRKRERKREERLRKERMMRARELDYIEQIARATRLNRPPDDYVIRSMIG
jgi:hypothetical protein